jgi:AAA15 family ATPase/GTPase
VLAWFSKSLGLVASHSDKVLLDRTAERLFEGKLTQQILDLSQRADLGITDLRAVKSDTDNIELFTERTHYGRDGQPDGRTQFRLSDESQGTQRFLGLTSQFLGAIERGGVLLVDEFDARLHPILSRAIVELFQSSANRHNAQLIFATHDTNLLDRRLLRRDQIWFTEKDPQGATDLYSLAGFQATSSDSFESDYIQGRYGAIPFIRTLMGPDDDGQL